MTQFKVESRSPVNVFCEILSKTKTPFCTGKTGILINKKQVYDMTTPTKCSLTNRTE